MATARHADMHAKVTVSLETSQPGPDGTITSEASKTFTGPEADKIVKNIAKSDQPLEVTDADRNHPGETCKATVSIEKGDSKVKVSMDGALCQSAARQMAPAFKP